MERYQRGQYAHSQLKQTIDPPVMSYGKQDVSRTIQHKHHSEKIDHLPDLKTKAAISEMPPIVLSKSKIKPAHGFNSSLGTTKQTTWGSPPIS